MTGCTVNIFVFAFVLDRMTTISLISARSLPESRDGTRQARDRVLIFQIEVPIDRDPTRTKQGSFSAQVDLFGISPSLLPTTTILSLELVSSVDTGFTLSPSKLPHLLSLNVPFHVPMYSPSLFAAFPVALFLVTCTNPSAALVVGDKHAAMTKNKTMTAHSNSKIGAPRRTRTKHVVSQPAQPQRRSVDDFLNLDGYLNALRVNHDNILAASDAFCEPSSHLWAYLH